MSISTGKCGQKLEWSYDDSTCQLKISGRGGMEDYDITDGDNRPWAEYATDVQTIIFEKHCCISYIGKCALANFTNLKGTIDIPETVYGIANNAFSGCTKLENITFQLGTFAEDLYERRCLLEYIGEHAFAGCKSIQTICIPQSVTSIGKFAFKGCTSLEKIYIPQKAHSVIPEGFLYNCKKLKLVRFYYQYNSTYEHHEMEFVEAMYSEIGKEAFCGCQELESFPKSEFLTNLGEAAFMNSGLKSFVVPDKIKKISKVTFRGCKNLNKIVLPNNIEEIDDYAFAECESLTDINLVDSLKIIGNGVFKDCKSLESVILPNTIRRINAELFSGCEKLKEIIISESLSEIHTSAISGCSSLKNVIVPGRTHIIGDETTKIIEKVIEKEIHSPSSPVKTYPAHSLLFFNLTGDSGLMPTDKAVRRFEDALSWNEEPFPNIDKDTLQEFWGKWFGENLLADVVEDTMWEPRIDELILRNIPIFIVNRVNSCKKYYIPALGSQITVPNDKEIELNEQLLPVMQDVNRCIYDLFPQGMELNNPNNNDSMLTDILSKKTGIFDVWGYFTICKDDIFGREIPAIFIWMDKLKEKANGNSGKLSVLFRLVLLHELAHALMFTGKFYDGTWHKINEESLANAFALTKIKATTKENVYEYAKEIVLSQPFHYALGAYYAEKYGTKLIYDKMESWSKSKYKVFKAFSSKGCQK